MEARVDCQKTKDHVGWASAHLSKRILSLSRTQLNQVIQVLTGHCNLQKHKQTTGRARTALCPKCELENETPEHHVIRCVAYQDMREHALEQARYQ